MPQRIAKTGGGQMLIRRQPLYDSVPLTTAGMATASQYDFFKIAVGGPEGAINKTYFHTNIETAGQIPAGMPFHVEGVSIMLWKPVTTFIDPSSAQLGLYPSDFYNLIFGAQAFFRFEIQREIVLECPLFQLPMNTTPMVAGNVSDVATFSNAFGSQKNYYDLGKNAKTLESKVNFTVAVRYDVGCVVKDSSTLRLFVFLHGRQKMPKERK